VTPVLSVAFRATPTYAADVTKRRLAGYVYVAAPAVLILLSAITDSEFAYLAALVVALPLSLVANVASFVVAALVLPSVDSNGAPIAAALMSGAALLQLLAVRAVLGRHRGPGTRHG
jgi:hypothetical protein